MCGRTACTLAPDEVSRAASYRDRGGRRRRPAWRDGDAVKYRPSYNKSPQSTSPVLLSQKHFDKNAPGDECVLAAMRWGLIPSWFREKDPSKMQYSTTNCRREGLLERKSFKDPLIRGQRCVILADGFYEWRRQEKEKQPYFIYFPQSQGGPGKATAAPCPPQSQGGHGEATAAPCTPQSQGGPGEATAAPCTPQSQGGPGEATTPSCPPEEDTPELKEEDKEEDEWNGWRLLTIAGLFDCWTPPDGGEALYTYSVITVEASPNLQGIHDRMPAVLDGEEEVRSWLDFGEVKSLDALKLLQSKNILSHHPVSTFVNNSRNNSPECLQPVDLQKKKEPKPTASSKMMMSWLKSSAPSKRKEPETSDYKEEEEGSKPKPETKPKPLEQWLKKPRI